MHSPPLPRPFQRNHFHFLLYELSCLSLSLLGLSSPSSPPRASAPKSRAVLATAFWMLLENIIILSMVWILTASPSSYPSLSRRLQWRWSSRHSAAYLQLDWAHLWWRYEMIVSALISILGPLCCNCHVVISNEYKDKIPAPSAEEQTQIDRIILEKHEKYDYRYLHWCVLVPDSVARSNWPKN